MAPIPIPDGWIEVTNTPPDMGHLETARALLNYSGQQYQNVTQRYLIKRMHPRKINAYYLMNLRVFLRSPDIAAFFFLRKRTAPIAYCLSPAALGAVPSDTLLTQLEAICRYMVNQDNAPELDVVSSVNPPVFTNANLNDSFTNAVTAGFLVYSGIVSNAEGWPAQLFRWKVVVQ